MRHFTVALSAALFCAAAFPVHAKELSRRHDCGSGSNVRDILQIAFAQDAEAVCGSLDTARIKKFEALKRASKQFLHDLYKFSKKEAAGSFRKHRSLVEGGDRVIGDDLSQNPRLAEPSHKALREFLARFSRDKKVKIEMPASVNKALGESKLTLAARLTLEGAPCTLEFPLLREQYDMTYLSCELKTPRESGLSVYTSASLSTLGGITEFQGLAVALDAERSFGENIKREAGALTQACLRALARAHLIASCGLDDGLTLPFAEAVTVSGAKFIVESHPGAWTDASGRKRAKRSR